jgi:hypothetical protein
VLLAAPDFEVVRLESSPPEALKELPAIAEGLCLSARIPAGRAIKPSGKRRSGSGLVGTRLALRDRHVAEERIEGFVVLDPIKGDVIEPLVGSLVTHAG